MVATLFRSIRWIQACLSSHLYSAYFQCAVMVPGSLECGDISHTKDFSSVALHTPDAVTPSQPRIPHRLQTGWRTWWLTSSLAGFIYSESLSELRTWCWETAGFLRSCVYSSECGETTEKESKWLQSLWDAAAGDKWLTHDLPVSAAQLKYRRDEQILTLCTFATLQWVCHMCAGQVVAQTWPDGRFGVKTSSNTD